MKKIYMLKIIAISLINYPNFLYATSFAKTFGGMLDEIAYSIKNTIDGGYIVAGYTNSFGAGSHDFLVIKLSYDGNIEWAKTLGGINVNIANSIQQTIDGGYIVGGYTNSFGAGSYDFLVIKLSYDGNIEWAKTLGGEENDELYSLELTDDGGYLLAGSTSSFGPGDLDILIIKLSYNGNMEWMKTFFEGGTYEVANFIQKTNDGYILAGYTWPLGAGDKDCLVLKLSSNYNIQWGRKYGGINYDICNSIIQANDGGYIFTGYTQSFGPSGSFLIIKLFPNGIVEWARIFGGGNIEGGNSITQTSDGYIIAGYTYSFGAGGYDFLIIKTQDSQMGSDCPWYSFYPTVTFADPSYSFPPPTITLPALTFNSPLIEVSSLLVQTFDVCTPVEVEEIISPVKRDKISLIFPKYFKNDTKITLYNVLGKELKEGKIEEFSKGIYFLKIPSKVIKIIKIH